MPNDNNLVPHNDAAILDSVPPPPYEEEDFSDAEPDYDGAEEAEEEDEVADALAPGPAVVVKNHGQLNVKLQQKKFNTHAGMLDYPESKTSPPSNLPHSIVYTRARKVLAPKT